VIYGLVDPRDQQLRYVGKTIVSLSARFDAHLNTARYKKRKTRTVNWLRGLLAIGLKPEIFEIERVSSGWIETEQFWIAYFRFIGCRLTNHTDGGEGLTGYSFSPEARARIAASNKGKIIPVELRERWSKAKTGKRTRPCPPEVRKKIADSQRGIPRPYARRQQSDEDRRKKSEAAFRRYQRPGERERASIINAANWAKKKLFLETANP